MAKMKKSQLLILDLIIGALLVLGLGVFVSINKEKTELHNTLNIRQDIYNLGTDSLMIIASENAYSSRDITYILNQTIPQNFDYAIMIKEYDENGDQVMQNTINNPDIYKDMMIKVKHVNMVNGTRYFHRVLYIWQ